MTTKQFYLIFSISLSIPSLGQRNPAIDSLTTELGNSMLKNEIEKADRLEHLLVAKEMALRSTEFKDSVLQALVAIQGYNFWTNNKGNFSDIDIYHGLYSALKSFNDPLINTLPQKIDKLRNESYAVTSIMADKLCSRLKRNMLVSEWNLFASQFPYERTCSLNEGKR